MKKEIQNFINELDFAINHNIDKKNGPIRERVEAYKVVKSRLEKILNEATVNEANPVCGVKNCNEPVYEFGRCFKHYCQSETT